MKLEVKGTDLKLDGEFYPEGTVDDFDEKKKSVKNLMAAGIFVKAGKDAEQKAPPKDKDKFVK